MTAGIYLITNIINQKYYLGSSINIEKRWRRHRSDLNNNKHVNIYLQRGWTEYGIDNFYFSILLNCDGYERNQIIKIEQEYLNNLDKNLSYNLSTNASGGDNITTHPNKDEIIIKIKNGLNNRYANMTGDDWRVFSESKKGINNGMFGKSHSAESIEMIKKKNILYWKENVSYKKINLLKFYSVMKNLKN